MWIERGYRVRVACAGFFLETGLAETFVNLSALISSSRSRSSRFIHSDSLRSILISESFLTRASFATLTSLRF